MDEMTLNLVILAVTGLAIAGLFFYLSLRKRRQQAAFEAAAQAQGWRVERIQNALTSGYLVTGGPANAHWSLETKAVASSQSAGPGSSEVSHSTRWSTQAIVLPGRAVVIGPAPPGGQEILAGGLASPLMRMALKQMLGDESAWVERLRPVPVSDAGLPLLCLADDPADARRLLSAEVTNALSGLPVTIKPLIKLRHDGLAIDLPNRQLDAPKDIAALVALGGACIRAWSAA